MDILRGFEGILQGKEGPVLCLQRRHPEDHPYHQRRGVAEPGAAQDRENQRLFPDRGAAAKPIFTAIRNFKKGGRKGRDQVAARSRLPITFTGRFDA